MGKLSDELCADGSPLRRLNMLAKGGESLSLLDGRVHYEQALPLAGNTKGDAAAAVTSVLARFPETSDLFRNSPERA